VEACKELQNPNRTITNALVRFRIKVLDGCLRATKAVNNRCQDALSVMRRACKTLPKSRLQPVLDHADNVDESLSQLQKAARPSCWRSRCRLSTMLPKTSLPRWRRPSETCAGSQRSQVKDAVAGVLIAIRLSGQQTDVREALG
jgi:hypothetical protein